MAERKNYFIYKNVFYKTASNKKELRKNKHTAHFVELIEQNIFLWVKIEAKQTYTH